MTIFENYSSKRRFYLNNFDLYSMNDLLKLILAITIIINYYYNSNKTKSIFDNSEKMIKIDIKKSIDLDKSTRKIYLIFDIRFFIVLIKIKKNIDFVYFYL